MIRRRSVSYRWWLTTTACYCLSLHCLVHNPVANAHLYVAWDEDENGNNNDSFLSEKFPSDAYFRFEDTNWHHPDGVLNAGQVTILSQELLDTIYTNYNNLHECEDNTNVGDDEEEKGAGSNNSSNYYYNYIAASRDNETSSDGIIVSDDNDNIDCSNNSNDTVSAMANLMPTWYDRDFGSPAFEDKFMAVDNNNNDTTTYLPPTHNMLVVDLAASNLAESSMANITFVAHEIKAYFIVLILSDQMTLKERFLFWWSRKVPNFSDDDHTGTNTNSKNHNIHKNGTNDDADEDDSKRKGRQKQMLQRFFFLTVSAKTGKSKFVTLAFYFA